MKISRLAFTACDLPFRVPLITARGPILSRRSILVALFCEDGSAGIGEAAPLPGFGTEDADTALRGLKELARKPLPDCPESLAEFSAWLESLQIQAAETPALAFGLECALASLLAEQNNIRLERLLNPLAPPAVRVNALVAGQTTDEILVGATRAVRAGYETLKVKVGHRSVRDDIAALRELRAVFPAVRLRVDANGAWPIDEARQFAHATAACNLEFIEDPLREPSLANLRILRRGTDAAIALDEPVRRLEDARLILNEKVCDFLVLKPTALGSFFALQSLAAQASTAHTVIVISSLLESSVGLYYVAACAAAFGNSNLAHGLGTAELLSIDTMAEPLGPVGGRLPLPEVRALLHRLSPACAQDLTPGKE